MYEIVMPQLSDSMEEGKLIEWKKHVGEDVHVGDVIAEVESDKAIMEVQSFKAGTLSSITVKEGDEVAVGTVIARIDTGEKESDLQKPKKWEWQWDSLGFKLRTST
jgi:pyruvate dehydrogenase E2 component (dihydrolipoamide acetyltransferase)